MRHILMPDPRKSLWMFLELKPGGGFTFEASSFEISSFEKLVNQKFKEKGKKYRVSVEKIPLELNRFLVKCTKIKKED